jgi:hypothetical protein
MRHRGRGDEDRKVETRHSPGGGSRPPAAPGVRDNRILSGPRSMRETTAAVVVVQPGTALPTELPEHEALRAGLEPATCRLGVDNRSRSGPQQDVRRGRGVRSERGIETARPEGRSSTEITEPLRPATIFGAAGPPGVEPGPTRLELVVLPLHHGPVKRTTRIERASPEWRPGALPSELRPQVVRPAGLEPAASAVAGQRSVR